MVVSKVINTFTGALVIGAIAAIPAPNAHAVPFGGFRATSDIPSGSSAAGSRVGRP